MQAQSCWQTLSVFTWGTRSFRGAPPTAESPHETPIRARHAPACAASAWSQSRDGTARMESSQARWCPLSFRVPSLVTTLLRLKPPQATPHLFSTRCWKCSEAPGPESGSAPASGLQSRPGPARCAQFRDAVPSCALSQTGRGRQPQPSGTRSQNVTHTHPGGSSRLHSRAATLHRGPGVQLDGRSPAPPRGSPVRLPAGATAQSRLDQQTSLTDSN